MVRRWAGRAMAGVALVAVAADAAAQGDGLVTRDASLIVRGAPPVRQQSVTAAGAPVLLFHYFNLGPDCGRTAVTVRLATPPAHGTVDIQDGEERPAWRGRPLYPEDDPRARCGDRLVATRDAIYTPAPGFVGADTMLVEITEAGATTSAAVDVSVLSVGRSAKASDPAARPR